MTVKQRFRELRKQNLKGYQIAEILNNEGYKTPTRKADWTPVSVTMWSKKWNLRKKSKIGKKTRMSQPKTKPNTPIKYPEVEAMLDIATSNLSESTKRKAMRAIAMDMVK